jgi:hypothetical protein
VQYKMSVDMQFGITTENVQLFCGFDVLHSSKLINYTAVSVTVFQNITKYKDNMRSINEKYIFC